MIENLIMNDTFKIGDQVYSTTQLSNMYNINPATARKGLTLLVEECIIFKKRGIGMFVSSDAVNLLLMKRKNNLYKNYILPLMDEARTLGLSSAEIIELIQKSKNQEDSL